MACTGFPVNDIQVIHESGDLVNPSGCLTGRGRDVSDRILGDEAVLHPVQYNKVMNIISFEGKL